MKEEVKKWWEQAKDDLEKARILFDSKKYDGTVFYCQQTVEKAIKALLLKEKCKIIKIHDLVKLSREINLPENLIEYCKEITQSYIYSRYPDIERPRNLETIAFNFLKYTEEILEWIKKQL